MQKFEKRQKPSDAVDCFYLAEIIAKAIRFVVAASQRFVCSFAAKTHLDFDILGSRLHYMGDMSGRVCLCCLFNCALISAGSFINT
jgi:hypothetical protein